MTRWILLLRGINVGRAKRMAMADLRRMLESLGFGSVRTLLNSGNVVFSAPAGAKPSQLVATIEPAILETFGFTSKCFVLSAAALDTIVRENTLADRAENPSRLVVVFLSEAGVGRRLAPLAGDAWGDEALAVGSLAAYLLCPGGIATSPLVEAVGRALRTEVTMRNWATVLKLQAAV